MGWKKRPGNLRHRSTPDPLAQKIGARIKALREEQDFSFDAFVGTTELGRGYVSELERGLVVPTVAVLDRVARALQITVADLVIEDSPREQLFDVCGDLPERDVRELLEEATRRAGIGK